MKRGRSFLAIALLVIVGVVVWEKEYPTIHIRYRLTVQVKVDDQVKMGVGVIDIAYPIYPDDFVYLGSSSEYRTIVGYAITLDLGDKGLLFLTFMNGKSGRMRTVRCPMADIACLPFAAYAGDTIVGGTYSREKASLQALQAQSGPREVSLSDLPALIRFRNINDPMSAEAISPVDLTASYGPGVAIQRVVVELTDDAVTPMPVEWPAWLKTIKGNLEGSIGCSLNALCLNSWDFRGQNNG
jgi:hypothetical protein